VRTWNKPGPTVEVGDGLGEKLGDEVGEVEVVAVGDGDVVVELDGVTLGLGGGVAVDHVNVVVVEGSAPSSRSLSSVSAHAVMFVSPASLEWMPKG
jgi:hypothetical protein